jgi:hypothetical protein
MDTVVNTYNKQNRTNVPLPLCFVDLKPNVNNENIYPITTLLYAKMRFEPRRPKRNIALCSKRELLQKIKQECQNNKNEIIQIHASYYQETANLLSEPFCNAADCTN